MKCTNSAKSRMDANIQQTINSFRQLFPDISLTFSKNPWHFPDSCQIPWHFQVFQTSGHPEVGSLHYSQLIYHNYSAVLRALVQTDSRYNDNKTVCTQGAQTSANAKISTKSDPGFQSGLPDWSGSGSLPKCCGFITSSASVISPTFRNKWSK